MRTEQRGKQFHQRVHNRGQLIGPRNRDACSALYTVFRTHRTLYFVVRTGELLLLANPRRRLRHGAALDNRPR